MSTINVKEKSKLIVKNSNFKRDATSYIKHVSSHGSRFICDNNTFEEKNDWSECIEFWT